MQVTAAASFCATLVDEWIGGGVRHAVIAPGSRSTPLALALAARDELDLHVVHDERAASFVALGIGLDSGVPAILLCTSGTAAAHFHAAVIEAHQAEVPLVVCTADRPPELRDVGAAQTIDQLRLFGPVVRWFHDPGVPDVALAPRWRTVAARSIAEATGTRPGPVHLNLPFREPLVGEPDVLPPGRDDRPWTTTLTGRSGLDGADLDALVRRLDRQRGVIVAGGGTGVRPAAAAIHRLASQLGWPVLAEPRSGCRTPTATTVAAFDAILRHDGFAADHHPEVVLRFGAPPASKVLEQWIDRSGADEIQVVPNERWLDPAQRLATRVVADPEALCDQLDGQLVGASRTPWAARWRRADHRAQDAIDRWATAQHRLTEPVVARTVASSIPESGRLVVSSSMPVRDVEWFAPARHGIVVHANRGANGIDGVISTGIGVAAASGRPTTVLIGDVAFLHDSTSLVGLARRPHAPSIVVVDNDGGGIFSFLPQASTLAADRFELLFGTPHGTDLTALAEAHGLPAVEVTDEAALAAEIGRDGPRVVVVRTDRAANVAAHESVHAAVRAALDA